MSSAAPPLVASPLRIGVWVLAIAALGVAVALPETQELILGVAAIAALIAALIQPLVALPLLLFAVPFGSLARTSSGDSSSDLAFGAAELLAALLGATWLATAVRQRALRIQGGVLVVTILAMVGVALLSIGWSEDRSLAIQESLKWLELGLAMVVVCDLAR